MIVVELLLLPTAATYTANLAPADMRGRYMSLLGLTWGVGLVMGGLLSDTIGPAGRDRLHAALDPGEAEITGTRSREHVVMMAKVENFPALEF